MCFLTQKKSPFLQDDLFDYPAIVNGNIQEFERFNHCFYNTTYSLISRFAGLKDGKVIELLTEIVFLKVYINKQHLIEGSPGGFLFQTTIRVVLRFLSNHDQHERVRAIEEMLKQENIFRAIAKNNQDAKLSSAIK